MAECYCRSWSSARQSISHSAVGKGHTGMVGHCASPQLAWDSSLSFHQWYHPFYSDTGFTLIQHVCLVFCPCQSFAALPGQQPACFLSLTELHGDPAVTAL